MPKPFIGSLFDAHLNNAAEVAREYRNALRYYRPRGFAKLANELDKLAERMFADKDGRDADAFQFAAEAQDEADTLLTEWARRVERHDYIAFGQFEHSGDVGFYINVEGAREDADLIASDTSKVPRAFTGMVLCVNDHGNASAYNYSRGRLTRTLFSVV